MEFESRSNFSQDLRRPPIDFRSDLNQQQFEAVTSGDHPSLVLAGAGTGKTRVLTYRVAYLLHRGVDPGRILLLTFTNKAAREMLSRVEELTGVARQFFWGGTFHSIGQRMLRRHGVPLGLEPNYTIMDRSDSDSLLADVIDEVKPGYLKDKRNPKAKLISNLISLSRNTCQSLDEMVMKFHPYYRERTAEFVRFSEAYGRSKLRQQVADFDDLLVFWLQILQTQEEVARHYQERFQHILIDEYQDTNLIQARIIDLLGYRDQIMAVGDDAQSIYSWRGANYENILHFPDKHLNTKIFRIETNYRSTPEILSFANGVIHQFHPGQGFHKTLVPARRGRQLPVMIWVFNGLDEAAAVILKIEQLQSEGRSLKDITVLYRAHYQALDLQMELTRQNIPFQITSGVRFFDQAHIKDLLAQVKFAYNPLDSRSFHRFVRLLPKIGNVTAERIYQAAMDRARISGQHVVALLNSSLVVDTVPKAAHEHWKSLTTTLQQIVEAARNKTPGQVINVAAEGWYSEYIKTLFPNYRERMDDLQSLVGFAKRFSNLQELLAQIVLLNSESSQNSAEPVEDQLRLTTVHQAKGLEFPVVFLLAASDGLFPLARVIEDGGLDEERRLFYVAVTRAMDELYMTTPSMIQFGMNTKNLVPSRFIQGVNPELYEKVKYYKSPSW